MSSYDMMNMEESCNQVNVFKEHITPLYFCFGLALHCQALCWFFLQARGMSLFQVGVAMGIYSFTIVLLEVPTGGLADAVGRKRVALVAYSLMAAMMVALLFAFSFPAAAAGVCVLWSGTSLVVGGAGCLVCGCAASRGAGD
ncbi:MAG: hypothetical protein M5U34_30175 [Chloroflexi bacterium]|nr:hypothetical protein [Chloroflexota bacterium]